LIARDDEDPAARRPTVLAAPSTRDASSLEVTR
jgi:hypothetical protein